MNNESVETQRLADIKALLDYVKGGIENIVDRDKTEQLDSMGQATFTMLTTLKDIQEGIGRSERSLLDLHSEITEETFKNIEEPLNELLLNIKDNTKDQEEFLNNVVKSYRSYEDTITQVTKEFNESKKEQEDYYNNIDEKINNISGGLESIEEQIPKEITYQASLKEINNSINRMIESERLNNDRYQEVLGKVDKELTEAQKILTETNDVLENIAETYEKSTGRLSVIDIKLNRLTDILSVSIGLGSSKDEVVGGIDNE